jgi:S-adenosylmethionine hydrolase
VQLNVRTSHLAAAGLDHGDDLSVETQAGAAQVKSVSTYADLAPDEWGVLVDPRGWLSVVRGNPGNAAEGLGVGGGDLVWITGVRG